MQPSARSAGLRLKAAKRAGDAEQGLVQAMAIAAVAKQAGSALGGGVQRGDRAVAQVPDVGAQKVGEVIGRQVQRVDQRQQRLGTLAVFVQQRQATEEVEAGADQGDDQARFMRGAPIHGGAQVVDLGRIAC